jgi:hypothetical protein
MNAETAKVFADARAKAAATTGTKTDAVITQPFDPVMLAHFHTREMEQAAAPAKVLNILANYDLALLSPAQRWERLPAASRRLLENF